MLKYACRALRFESERIAMLLDLKNVKCVAGTKQVLKLLDKGSIKLVYVADDAEAFIVKKLNEACKEHGVDMLHVATMKELGDCCGLDVGAACVGLLQ